MNMRFFFLLCSFLSMSTAIQAMHKPEADTLDCVSGITDIQKLVLEYLYEWQPRETIQCSNRIYSQTYSLDGNSLIIGLDGRKIEIFDAHTGACTNTLKHHEGTAVEGLCALPNNKFLASVATAGALVLYNMQNSSNITAKTVHAKKYDGHAKQMAHSRGNVAAQVHGTKTMKIWQITELDKIHRLGTFRKHTDQPYALAYSPDGNYLATGSYDPLIKITDTKHYHTVSAPNGHQGYVKEILWIAPNKIIALYGPKPSSPDITKEWLGKAIQIWDVSNFSEPRCIKKLELQNDSNSIVSSFSNRYLIFDSHTGYLKRCNICVWDIEQEKLLDLSEPFTSSSDIAQLVISPDGRYLACASGRDDCRVKIWENPAAALLTAINSKSKK